MVIYRGEDHHVGDDHVVECNAHHMKSFCDLKFYIVFRHGVTTITPHSNLLGIPLKALFINFSSLWKLGQV